MKLENKTIIVTGGSLGIGLTVSKKIAQEGGTVIIFARDKNNLVLALRELKKISDKEHNYFVGDVSNHIDVQMFSGWIETKYKQINGLVNCAGVYGPIGKTTQVYMKDFLDTININLMGTIYMCNSFAKLFSSDSIKKIVNFSGGGAATPFPNYSAYATSKIALVRFTENLALELKDDNFEVNCIAPGFVATRLHTETLDAGSQLAGELFYENTKKQLETGGVSAELAANLTTFLLSEDSNGISGKFISAPWDNWEDESFQQLLKTDKDFATIRRIDNKTFFKK
jgi:NAD(P)-dependent dehydrogenase (short-subunit alcohol dehydrogenase family)